MRKLVLAALAASAMATPAFAQDSTFTGPRVEALVATSLSLLDNDRETAALLAAEAYRRWPDDPRVRSALWGVITTTGGLLDVHRDEEAAQPAMDMIPGTSTALRAWSQPGSGRTPGPGSAGTGCRRRRRWPGPPVRQAKGSGRRRRPGSRCLW